MYQSFIIYLQESSGEKRCFPTLLKRKKFDQLNQQIFSNTSINQQHQKQPYLQFQYQIKPQQEQPMQIQDAPACFNQVYRQPPQFYSSPKTVQQFFDSDQYRLALSGSSTSIMAIIVRNQRLHNELVSAMLLLDAQSSSAQLKQPKLQHTTSNLSFKIHQFFLLLGDEYANFMMGFNGHIPLEVNGKFILKNMFRIFKTRFQINETAAGYLYSLIDMVLCRLDCASLFYFFRENRGIVEDLAYHFENLTAVDIVFKSFQTNNQDISPQQKVQLLRRVLFIVVENIESRVDVSQQLMMGIKYLCQKVLDKGNIRKVGTTKLCQYILDSEIIDLISDILKNQEHTIDVRTCCLQIYNIFLNQNKIKTQNKNKSKLPNKNKYFGKSLTDLKICTLSSESVLIIIETYSNRSNFLLNFSQSNSSFKRFKFQFVQSLELLSLFHPQSLVSLLNAQLIMCLLNQMTECPYNNLFHISVQQIIIVLIQSNRFFEMIKQSSLNVLQFIIDNFIGNEAHGFTIHLSFIIQRILSLDLDVIWKSIKQRDLNERWIICLNKLERMKTIKGQSQEQEEYKQDIVLQLFFEETQKIRNSILAIKNYFQSKMSAQISLYKEQQVVEEKLKIITQQLILRQKQSLTSTDQTDSSSKNQFYSPPNLQQFQALSEMHLDSNYSTNNIFKFEAMNTNVSMNTKRSIETHTKYQYSNILVTTSLNAHKYFLTHYSRNEEHKLK